ncbi:DUF2075 domain-containing protein [Mucilaginibacter conchicola]|uniref:DUF2075 domain-containing protein n=1 Tax=Mucilaginibacter conchicola TaxID=2303333 RepID=A0A372NVL4_9SPHI|nr:DUF2075 domain-containing protein [Mucilaginibacter conchicola]RFZ93001.1 DUF2075 domain-containing protein [Mucilaginibacter conchicola]
MSAFYCRSIAHFLADDTKSILGTLTHQAGLSGFHQQLHTQTLSWDKEITILKNSFKKFVEDGFAVANYHLLLEYPIARREKRIDAVLLAEGIIFVIEFKVGSQEYNGVDKEQVLDYCLDLRDFHFQSRDRIIIPVLVATHASSVDLILPKTTSDVRDIIYANNYNLADYIIKTLTKEGQRGNIDADKWNKSDYAPTIIEAAQTLYSGKSVVEISRSHAGTKNLTKTSNAVINAIKDAKANNEKIVCFITGVPGAGKTLAGLNIAHYDEFQDSEKSLATFLSGNGPLIKVLREALSRDAFRKIKATDKNARKKETDRIISFIENVHRFLDYYFNDKTKVPNNKIVIFDEAQRAWNQEHSMRKFQRPHSEADMIFEIMSRHEDWAVIVALVGGGQEINTGEAGLPEWGKVLSEKFNEWKIYVSPQLMIGNHSTGDLTLFETIPTNVEIIKNNDLHLDVSIRSYKAEKLSEWVNLILTNKPDKAKQIFESELSKFEIVLTRDLNKAKQWLKLNCKGTRRAGLVASSGARRLRPYGLEVKLDFEESEWFLNSKDDVRSSNYLEIPATEFGVQGLELDWAGVCWDGDLRRENNSWAFNSFKGTKWQKVSKIDKKNFIINKYRVLLTRAREGMVIFVPPGDQADNTRKPREYNEIASYLIACGVKEI